MLKIIDIHKNYHSQTILHGIDLEIKEGEFFSLLGESGCGKTTLLRILAGLETASKGSIYLNGQRIDTIPAQKRPFNMVFQRYALFPHLSVFDNVAFGPKLKVFGKNSLCSQVEETLKLVNLYDLKDRLPETLSGGQQQRVALARAVINHPKVLLLDEPLSALDKKMRESMREELKNLQRKVGITFILVTHDQEEALALSHRIAVMNRGRLEQVSTPEELYHHPETLFVSEFVGDSTSLTGPVINRHDSGMVVEMKVGDYQIRGFNKGVTSQHGVAIVRPEKVRFHLHTNASTNTANQNMIQGQVRSINFKGSQSEVYVDIGHSQNLKVFIQDHRNARSISIGDAIDIGFAVQDTFIFDQPFLPSEVYVP